MDQAGRIAASLANVGGRLRGIRERRGLTLVQASEETGISKSTLSRLENGQRRPTLELLLPLAWTYRVPLDDLVGAPDVGDPRIWLRPRRVKERTVIPLTSEASVQAWKIVIPATLNEPHLRSHEGTEWIYVLSGRLRLIIADDEFVLDAGEACEFDTGPLHWFGSTGLGPVELLSIFRRPGDQFRMREVQGVPSTFRGGTSHLGGRSRELLGARSLSSDNGE
jgi:transcriptional regulator with XRE-family HTH domain